MREDFPPEVLAEAEQAAAAPRLPDEDLTALPFVTVDPETSRDLDQAVHLERSGAGYRLRYAIADVGAFVRPGRRPRRGGAAARRDAVRAGPAGARCTRRCSGEDAASLLAGQVRPAVVWDLRARRGRRADRASTSAAAWCARWRSCRTTGVQAQYDAGTADELLLLLREVGRLRQERAAERGAVDLPTLEQEVEVGADGRPVLSLRRPLPVEGWNAQISLLTGATAARLMLDGGVGLLRTMPPPADDDVASLRRSALALGLPWPEGTSYAAAVSALDPHDPRAAALLVLATRLLRGAGYTAFDGAAARARHPQRGRGGVRARDRPAAPPRRPLRPADLRRPRRRRAGPRRRPGRAARAARRHGRRRPGRGHARPRGRRPGRGAGARAARRGAVPGVGRGARRGARRGAAGRPAGAGAVRGRGPAARRRAARRAGHRRPGDAGRCCSAGPTRR